MAKAKYPGIPAVTSDQQLAATVRALVEAVELLTGQRTDKTLKAMTMEEVKALIAQAGAS